MTQSSTLKAPTKSETALGSLTADERSCVLRELLVAHPELQDQAERVASGLLTTVSVEQVAADVESVLAWISLDALAARAGRVWGRGYVHESEAAWELVDEAIAPFRLDLDRRAALGLLDAAADLAVGIVAGLYRARAPEMGTVLAYAGDDTQMEVAAEILDRAAELGVTVPDDDAAAHWPRWSDLR